MPNDIYQPQGYPAPVLNRRRLMRSAHALKTSYPDHCWRANLTTAWRFEKLRKAMQSDVIRFAYIKNDGSTREARGTLCNKYIPFRAQPKGVYEADGDNEPLRFNYYDIDAGWWRSFYIDAFIDTLDEPVTRNP